MKKISNEIKIGLTIAIALLIAIVGFRFMQDMSIFRQTDNIHTHFERTDGINVGTSILMSGVKIGTVRRIRLTEADSVAVELNITYGGGIPKGSIASIESVDMIGNKAVAIRKSDRQETIEDGGYIRGQYDEGIMGELRSYSEEIGPNVAESTESLSSLLQEIDIVMREGGNQDIQQFLQHLNRTTQNVDRVVSEKEQELTRAMNSLQNILDNVDTLSAGHKEQLDSLFTNLETTGRELNSITTELNAVSAELGITMQKINNGEGSLGLFINDPSLYQNLDTLSYNMNQLIKEMNDDPRQFLKHMNLINLF
ncbi:MAG: MlaD family protein [Balneolales bacterium]